jgi:hypothetical protein
MANVIGSDATWPVNVELGETVEVMTRTAITSNAQLIAVDGQRHSRTARLIARDLA